MTFRAQKPTDSPTGNSVPPDGHEPIPLKPIEVMGFVVRKAAVIEALRVYCPGIIDFEAEESGERFLIIVGPAAAGGPSAS